MISRVLNFIAYRLINIANRINLQDLQRFTREDPTDELRFAFTLDENSVVVDIGGFTGDWASGIYCRYSCYIDVFEPHPDFSDKIRRLFAGNRKVRIFQNGLSSEAGEMILYGDNAAASLYPDTDTTVSHKVPILKASDTFRERYTGQTIDLLKINSEGSEYEILPDLMRNYGIGNIKRILIQFHKTGQEYETKRNGIRKILERTHTMIWNYDYVFECWVLRDE